MKFIHIPRTGGTTIASQIGHDAGHLPAKAFPGEHTFALVRNPYARIVSILASDLNLVYGYPDELSMEEFEDWVLLDGMLIDVVNRGTEYEMSFAAPQVCFIDSSTKVFRREDHDAVTDGVRRLTGVTLDGRVLHRTQHLPIKRYFRKADVRAAVIERYRIDFDAFGYSEEI